MICKEAFARLEQLLIGTNVYRALHFASRRDFFSSYFSSSSQMCTELITNNAAAALAVPVALSIAKELEVRR